MAKNKALSRAANGLFYRNLGWKRTPGGYIQHKFYLGRDAAKAALAALRLEQLWEQACKRWERDNGRELQPTERPAWDAVTLAIAEAVRAGEAMARVPLPVPYCAMLPGSWMIAEWLDELQADITVIKVEVVDQDAQGHSEEHLRKRGQRLIEIGRRMLNRGGGCTLHAALDAYTASIEAKYRDVDGNPTPWGGTQTRQVAFIARHLPDCELSDLDAARVDECFDILRLRPKTEGERPASASWARNCIKQFRHFLRWLSRSPQFDWRLPADVEFGRLRVPLTPGEKAAPARSAQVKTYTAEELETLFEYASPFQRLLMLLALNCGFGRAELASLTVGEVLLRRRHPRESDVGVTTDPQDSWVIRVRHKTGVYGEWKLWRKTVEALEWWLMRRSRVAAAGVDALLVTRGGRPLDRPTSGGNVNCQIPNGWYALTTRVRKDHPGFRRLSFGKLRKTAGNLIRQEGGGEVAGTFLCHGTPVRADALLDFYTNRPFARVFAAIDQVGERLRPLWDGVPEPFPPDAPEGGPNISRATIRRIQELILKGQKPAEVAGELGLSRETVRRWAKRPAQAGGSASVP